MSGTKSGKNTITRIALLLAAATLALGLVLWFDLRGEYYFTLGRPRPNIVIVLVDTLRADHLTCYGHFIPTPPFMDRLAQEGARFENCRAQAPWTKPSVASLFTSLYSSAHQVVVYPRLKGEVLDPHLDRRDILPRQVVTIAEALSEQGYHTAAFVANRWVDPVFGFRQGFDDWFSAYLRTAPGNKSEIVLNLPAGYLNGQLEDYLAERYPPSWMDRLGTIGVHRRPLFLYLHYMDVHGPYQAPAPFTAMFDDAYQDLPDITLPPEAIEKWKYLYQDTASVNFYRARYDAQIRYFDSELKKLMERMTAAAWARPLIMVVTADHGESFFEHQTLEHGNSMYDEELHVPLIIWGAPELPAGTRVAAPVELIDVAPTLLGMAGAPRQEQFEGRSLIEAAREGGDYPQWSENYIRKLDLAALVSGSRKWIYDVDQGRIIELYDLGQDPGEKNNLIRRAAPEEVRKKTRLMQNWLAAEKAKLKIEGESPSQVLPDDIRKQLEALGYLGH